MVEQRTTQGTQKSARIVGADRVLAVLSELGRHPNGVSLDALSAALASPKPTIHRALAALRRAGFAGQLDDSRYVLGDELLRMAFAHDAARPDRALVEPVLGRLAAQFGETAHFAVLDGREVVYRAKVDPPTGAVRLTSTVGGRNPAHATAVGKALLAARLTTPEAVLDWADGGELASRTPATRTSAEHLWQDLVLARQRGFATEEEENEAGVVCIAFPVAGPRPGPPLGAISVSALAYRTPLASLVARSSEIREILGPLRCEYA